MQLFIYIYIIIIILDKCECYLNQSVQCYAININYCPFSTILSTKYYIISSGYQRNQ